jgi:hypothetical protein
MTYPFKKGKTKHFAVRIKPRVMKRRWKSMPMKRKNNLDEAQHVVIFSHPAWSYERTFRYG